MADLPRPGQYHSQVTPVSLLSVQSRYEPSQCPFSCYQSWFSLNIRDPLTYCSSLLCSWIIGQMVESWRLDQQRPLSDASLCLRTLSGIPDMEGHTLYVLSSVSNVTRTMYT